jgi:Domain of unknown function (DUF4386)
MESRLERVGGVAAILGIVLLVVANIQLGTPPKSEDPATKTAMFLADKRSQVLLYVALFAIAYILLVTFGAALRQLLRRSGDPSALPDLVLGSTLWIVAVGFASLLGVGAAAYRSPAVTAGTAQVLSDVTSIGFAVLGAPFAVLFASASISAMNTRALPRWVGWLGLLTAVLNVAKLLTIFPRSGGFAPNGEAGLLFLLPIWVWTIAVAIVMWRGAPQPVPGEVSART